MDSVRTVLKGWQQSILPEVKRYWVENPDITGRRSPPQITPEHDGDRPAANQQRPRKKVQSGWIEERKANPKRQRPTTCYYFCWYEMQDEARRKLKTYVPQRQMSAVWKCCKIEKRPYFETLQLIQKSRKPHHTDTPKL